MKLKLLAKMLMLILIPVLIGTATLATVSYFTGDTLIREQIDMDIKITLDTASTGLNAVFTGLKEVLYPINDSVRLVDLALAYDTGGMNAVTDTLAERGDQLVKNFVQTSELVYASFIIARDGHVLAGRVAGESTRSSEVGSNLGSRDYVQEAMQNGRNATRGVIDNGRPATVIAVPIKYQGRMLGVTTARLRNEAISKATTDQLSVGKKGRAYAYDQSGRIVLALDKNRLGRDESSRKHVREIIQNRNGKLSYTDDDGEKFVYYREQPEQHWIMCIEIDAAEMLRPTNDLLRNLALVTLVIILVIGGLIFYAARIIAGTTASLAGIADSVAAGHLEASATEERFLLNTERRGDEFSVLSVAMRTMMHNLKKLMDDSNEKTKAAEKATAKAEEATAIAEEAAKKAENAKKEGMLAAAGRLEDMVAAISAAANELSAQIEQSDRSAVESSSRLTEAATAMNEMNSTVQEVAHNASSASTVSNNTKHNAEEGQKILTNAMTSINQVQKVSMELKEDMSKLHEHTQNISQIMNVISDIADQTNLLALNAAIEAARAGEAGRGFAVVADEVRKLAEKTMASTNDVSHAITAIQSSAQQSVNRMEEAMQNVEQATSLAQQSGDALNKIVSDVEETADQVRAIATASEEQSAASEEINRSISTVAEMSNQTTQAMSEAAKAISDLAQQTERLSTLIGEMKRN